MMHTLRLCVKLYQFWMILVCVMSLLWLGTSEYVGGQWRMQTNLEESYDSPSLLLDPHQMNPSSNKGNIVIYQLGKDEGLPDQEQEGFKNTVDADLYELKDAVAHFKRKEVDTEYRRRVAELYEKRRAGEIKKSLLGQGKSNNIKINQEVRQDILQSSSNRQQQTIAKQVNLPAVLPKSSKILHVNQFPSTSNNRQFFKEQQKDQIVYDQASSDQIQEEYLKGQSDLASRAEKVLFTSFIQTLLRFIKLLNNNSENLEEVVNMNSTQQNQSPSLNDSSFNSSMNGSVLGSSQIQSESKNLLDLKQLYGFKLNQNQNLFQLQQYNMKIRRVRKKKICFVICMLSFGVVSILLIRRLKAKQMETRLQLNGEASSGIRLPSEEIQQVQTGDV